MLLFPSRSPEGAHKNSYVQTDMFSSGFKIRVIRIIGVPNIKINTFVSNLGFFLPNNLNIGD